MSTYSSGEPRIPYIVGWYRLESKLGAGYSGSIWRATHVHTGHTVAIKLQHVDHECPTNRYERGFYPLLYNAPGMPTLWAEGIQGEWDYLAIDLLGPSLDALYRSSGKDCFDLRTVCCVAQQLIERLQTMHNRGVLHRDIQLGNCTLGLAPSNTMLYMIDFGFSKRYIDQETRRHIPESNKKRDFIGNYWFSSVAVHCKGKVPSRRDDLEAAALMLIHMLTPRGLPWTRNGVPKDDDAHNRLKHEKQTTRPADLCRGLPSPFEEFLRYCRRLKFMETPDYDRWIEEFSDLAADCGFGNDDDIIWPPPPSPEPVPNYVPRRSMGPSPDDMAEILQGLGQLNLAERHVLADRQNVNSAVQRARKEAEKGKIVIDLSGMSQLTDATTDTTNSRESRDTLGQTRMNPKAHRIALLITRVEDAGDNQTLATLIEEFVGVLKLNSSRAMTKEGFSFLDSLYKQLADPSSWAPPLRTQRSRDEIEQENTKESSNARLGVVAGLRSEVRTAINNKALASMIADFGKVTNKGSGRTVTKDGFAFLLGAAERLKTL